VGCAANAQKPRTFEHDSLGDAVPSAEGLARYRRIGIVIKATVEIVGAEP
jgi:hypothetical protein